MLPIPCETLILSYEKKKISYEEMKISYEMKTVSYENSGNSDGKAARFYRIFLK